MNSLVTQTLSLYEMEFAGSCLFPPQLLTLSVFPVALVPTSVSQPLSFPSSVFHIRLYIFVAITGI